MEIIIINGPNLNLIGKREPEIYGNTSIQDYFVKLKVKYPLHSLQLEFYNSESEIIERIQSQLGKKSKIILNAGALSHTSIAIMDALQAINATVIEVHISNIFKREQFRHNSYISKVAEGIISGLGLSGYDLAIQYLIQKYE